MSSLPDIISFAADTSVPSVINEFFYFPPESELPPPRRQPREHVEEEWPVDAGFEGSEGEGDWPVDTIPDDDCLVDEAPDYD